VPTGTAQPTFSDPGALVVTSEPPTRTAERAALEGELDAVRDLTKDELLARYPVSLGASPTYDLSQVAGLEAIQGSTLALDATEMEHLGARGFVISSRWQSPSFMLGYSTIYLEDLPVYVSADSILFALHRSYDHLLATVETASLSRDLDALLARMRDRLGAGDTGFARGQARAHVDVYLAVALSLLRGSTQSPVAGGDAALIAELVTKADAAAGLRTVELFGVARDEDFSQFEPRGHYTNSAELSRYFRAMMWLGRIDFRMLETQDDGSQLFRRAQVESALALRDLMDDALRARFTRISATVAGFVGEPDYMQLPELDALLADLGVTEPSGLDLKTDAEIAQAITAGGYGEQRIASHFMVHGPEAAGTLPLSSSFALFGQVYVLDSEVFSNVVFDRAGGGGVLRMMPNPLDVAFAAFGNDQAAGLLGEEMDRYPYAPDLAAQRLLADAHPAEFWEQNLYNRWLGAIRTLSPSRAPAEGLPPVAKSERWGKRLLSSQLASWAELRHDTILYVKQSYTSGNSCDFPDAYVDPYPEFYAKIRSYAELGLSLSDEVGLAPEAPDAVRTKLHDHFALLGEVAERLGEMAEHELTGAPFTTEMLDFINDAVSVQSVCGASFLENGGWYGKLFAAPNLALEYDPTIADVHTQPTDEGGNVVGKVLHVGTGAARLMVVIAEGCSGPRAYAGLASSYHEVTTDDFERLTDEAWSPTAYTAPDPPWLADVVD
jgi:hypothetical protein